MDQINFTGKNRSDAVTKVTRRMTDRIMQKSQRQASFDSDFVDGDLLPPQSSRARSTSQYYHRLDEQSHQQLIDSAVTWIQQEKMFKDAKN